MKPLITAASLPAVFQVAASAAEQDWVSYPGGNGPGQGKHKHKNAAGQTNKIVCTTMGAATDLSNEGLRRLVVNGVFWGLGLEVSAMADVSTVGTYEPLLYGFNGFRRNVKPSSHNWIATPE
jgi:hypothetical protein